MRGGREEGGVRPYYDEGGIAIYHGDCLDVLPALDLARVGVIVGDPPYGVGLNQQDGRLAKDAAKVYGDDKPYDPAPLLALGLPMVLWGANAYADRLPASRGWLVWDKTHADTCQHSQAELAWASWGGGIRMHREAYHGFMRARDGWLHPTQKPVALYLWIYAQRRFPATGAILDPYLGAGASLLAAKQLGRRAIGIEIEERYCEIAARRLAQGVLDLGGSSGAVPGVQGGLGL